MSVDSDPFDDVLPTDPDTTVVEDSSTLPSDPVWSPSGTGSSWT